MNVSEKSLSEVLRSSVEMLKRRPILFAPKLASSAIGAVWFIAFLEQYGSLVHYLVSLPILMFMSVFVSALVSAMVKGIGEENDRVLSYALSEIRSRVWVLASTSIVLMLATFLISLPMSLGLFMYLSGGAMIFLISGFLITIVLSLALAFSIYFLPATLISSNSMKRAFSRSFSSSRSNRGDVVKLTLLSFLLLGIASASPGIGRTIGYIGFVLGRLISSVVSTYLYVVSPKYYFD